ncbi:MAG TPA: prefoldin subunit alpha [Methanosarcinales archaeon]|nr:prefoldin subunit alpha [Methanosarcinales archaeon]
MAEQLTDEELQRLVAQHNAYQARAQAVAEQIEAIQLSIFECEHASNTVDALKDLDDVESFVPIGAGSFIHAKITKSDRAIINLGAGVAAEMSADAAKDRLVDRKEKLTKILEEMNITLEDLVKKVQAIQIEADRQMQERKADQAYI